MIRQLIQRLKKIVDKHPLLVIFSAAIILLLPQLISGNMIMGSDSIFHFNRFYDAAMQIKEGNFQYFISMYGFQSAGRIINALYSPYFAYIQGALLLLAGTWFRYQVLTNLMLYLTAGFSLYFFLKKLSIRKEIRLTMAIVFLSTFAVQYWVTRQGFNSWGAAILPLCLTPIITMEQGEVKALQLGFFTALMFQIHFLSSLFLIMIYVPYFIRAFIKTQQRLRLLLKSLLAVIFFALLTMNIWVSMLSIYSGNEILAPFINRNMAEAAITAKDFYIMLAPIFLILIFWVVLFLVVTKWKKLPAFTRLTICTSLFFFALASNLVPWDYLVGQELGIVQLIQFPFRFALPGTVLLLVSFALLLNEKHRALRFFKLKPMVFIAVVQTVLWLNTLVPTWSQPKDYLFSTINTYIQPAPSAVIKQAFYSEDLSLAMRYIQKSTPDYLPIYEEHEGSKYKLYHQLIIKEGRRFTKKVKDGKLIVTWVGGDNPTVSVPVIGYQNTELVLNGEKTTAVDHTAIGSLRVNQKNGRNQLEVSYRPPKFFAFSLWVSLGSFAFYFGYQWVKKWGSHL